MSAVIEVMELNLKTFFFNTIRKTVSCKKSQLTSPNQRCGLLAQSYVHALFISQMDDQILIRKRHFSDLVLLNNVVSGNWMMGFSH